MEFSIFAAGVLVAAVAFALFQRKRRVSRARPLDAGRPQLHLLALMVDGSFLVVTQAATKEFVQFYVDEHQGKSVRLVLDVPKAGANERAFDPAVNALTARFPSLTRFSEPTSGSEVSLEVIRLPIEGEPAEVASKALELAEAVFAALGGEAAAGYIFDLHGRRDEAAATRASEDGLRMLGDARIPILSRLARNQLKKNV